MRLVVEIEKGGLGVGWGSVMRGSVKFKGLGTVLLSYKTSFFLSTIVFIVFTLYQAFSFV